MTLVFATANPGKVREMQRLLGDRVRLEPLPHGFVMPEETGGDYAENALLKARAVRSATLRAALADDSGLEVDALGGAPGPRSARYAETDDRRIARLLEEIEGVPAERRSARFRCVLAVVLADGREWLAEGTSEGRIADSPAGSGGFGYDPVFYVPEAGRTFAEMSEEEKDAISHRGRAARELAGLLEEIAA
ncbi:MAG: RdgB/HAM1 family non-canonical purine NTP pyrophosphatase [Candidatus Binatia bacterium]